MKKEYSEIDNADQIERLKKYCLSSAYSCNGEIYKYLNGKYLINLLKDISLGSVQLSSSLVFGRDIITKEELFLYNLDKYIGYVKNHYKVDYIELSMLIEMSLGNKYSDILFSLDDFHKDQNYNMYFDKFRKMFLFNFYDNICFYSKIADKKSPIIRFLNEIEQYDFDSENGIIEIDRLLTKIINYRKNNLYNAFVHHSEYSKKQYDFYLSQIEWILDDYYNSELTTKFEITEKDNYIIVDEETTILFNVISDLNSLKKDDDVLVTFGIKNKNFNALVTDDLFRKKEFDEFIKILRRIKANFECVKKMDLINPTLRFNFTYDDSRQWLDICFEFGEHCDYYYVSICKEDIDKLFDLIMAQIS